MSFHDDGTAPHAWFDWQDSNRRRDVGRARIQEESLLRRAASKAETLKRKKVKSRDAQRKRLQKKSRKMIGEFSPAAIGPSSAPSVLSPHNHYSGAEGLPTSDRSRGWTSPRKGSPSVLRWSDAGDQAQLMFACRAIVKLGGANAYSFTLLLSPDYQRRTLANPDWFRRRLVEHVGPNVPLLMSFGVGESGVLHVHGVVVLCPSKGSAADEQGRIKAKMEAAGGLWAATRRSQHQVVMEPHYNPDYWGGTYLNRNRLEAEAVFARGRSWSMTNSVRREAKRLYGEIRQHINGAQHFNPIKGI